MKKIKKIAGLEKTQVVMYSNSRIKNESSYNYHAGLNYIDLPGNSKTMASILQNLLNAE